MKQYCRYCANLHWGDSCYCDIKKRCLSESYCKHTNNCKDFELNPEDAFFENLKGYHPREPKKKECKGQMELFGKEQP